MESQGLNSAMYFLNGFDVLQRRLHSRLRFPALLYTQSGFLDCATGRLESIAAC